MPFIWYIYHHRSANSSAPIDKMAAHTNEWHFSVNGDYIVHNNQYHNIVIRTQQVQFLNNFSYPSTPLRNRTVLYIPVLLFCTCTSCITLLCTTLLACVPTYIGLMLHAHTRKRELVDRLEHMGISISYDRVLSLSAQLGNSACSLYHQVQVVCPPKMRESIFTTAVVELRALDSRSSARHGLTGHNPTRHSQGLSGRQFHHAEDVQEIFSHSYRSGP